MMEAPSLKIFWTAVVWFGLGALYLFFAGTIGAVEIGAMMACTSLGTALAVGLKRVAHRRLSFRIPFHAIWRPAAALAPETLSVGRSLVATLLTGTDEDGHRGAFVRQPFDPGGDDLVSAGRRAVALIGVSLAPATFVVRGERSRTMILHSLPPKPASPDLTWPA